MSVSSTVARDLLKNKMSEEQSKKICILNNLPSERQDSSEIKSSIERSCLEIEMLLNSSVGVFESVGITSYPGEDDATNRPIVDFWTSSSTSDEDKIKREESELNATPGFWEDRITTPAPTPGLWEERVTVSEPAAKTEEMERKQQTEVKKQAEKTLAASKPTHPTEPVIFSTIHQAPSAQQQEDPDFAQFLSPFASFGFQEMQRKSKSCYYVLD